MQYTYLRDTLTKPNSENAGQRHHLTFQISTKSRQAFLRYESLKIGSNNKSCHKMQIHYPIVLKFGKQQDGVRGHHGTKFGHNTMNGHKVINNCSQKNSTNMLSRLQGKPLMARLKIGKEIG